LREPFNCTIIHDVLIFNEINERNLRTLRAALMEGERSGETTEFEIESFLARERTEYGK